MVLRRRRSKVDVLRGLTLFARCSDAELEDLAAITEEIEIATGRVFVKQGERGRELFAVVEGTVEVTIDGSPIEPRGGHEVFGEIALLTGSPRSATVTATSPVRALVITGKDFDELLESQPGLHDLLRATAEARLGSAPPG